MVKPAAIIFDFDGVLVDSIPAHIEAWEAVTYQLFRQKLQNPSQYVGHSTKTIAHKISQSLGFAGHAAELAKAKRGYVNQLGSKVKLVPGAREFVAACKANNLPIAIGTNNTHDFVVAALKANDLDIDHRYSADDVKYPKPDPELYLHAMNRLGIPTDQHHGVIVFEDSSHGLAAAVAAGTVAIGVTTDQSADTLKEAGAVTTVANFHEALEAKFHLNLPD